LRIAARMHDQRGCERRHLFDGQIHFLNVGGVERVELHVGDYTDDFPLNHVARIGQVLPDWILPWPVTIRDRLVDHDNRRSCRTTAVGAAPSCQDGRAYRVEVASTDLPHRRRGVFADTLASQALRTEVNEARSSCERQICGYSCSLDTRNRFCTLEKLATE